MVLKLKKRNLKVKLISFCFLIFSLVGCQKSIDYIKEKMEPRPLLVGYQSVVLDEELTPEYTINFDYNSSKIDDLNIQSIGELISPNKIYVIEGTAGSNQSQAYNLAQERALNTIKVLLSQDISTKDIYIASYNPSKPGRKVHIYTIQH